MKWYARMSVQGTISCPSFPVQADRGLTIMTYCHDSLWAHGDQIGEAKRRICTQAVAQIGVVLVLGIFVGDLLVVTRCEAVRSVGVYDVDLREGASPALILLASGDVDLGAVGGSGSGEWHGTGISKLDGGGGPILHVKNDHCGNAGVDQDQLCAVGYELRIE